MPKEKFGIAVDEEIVQEADELIAECDGLGAAGSEIAEAILTAFVQSESNHAERVRDSRGKSQTVSHHWSVGWFRNLNRLQREPH